MRDYTISGVYSFIGTTDDWEKATNGTSHERNEGGHIMDDKQNLIFWNASELRRFFKPLREDNLNKLLPNECPGCSNCEGDKK